MLLTLTSSPVGLVAAVWLFRDILPQRTVIAAGVVVIATTILSSAFAVRANRLRTAGLHDTSRWLRLIPIVAAATVYAVPPWLVPHDDPTRAAIALFFPIAASATAVVVFAAVRRWFLAYQTIIAVPTFLWMMRAGPPFTPVLAITFVAYIVLTGVLQSEVHRLVVRSLTMKLRNEALVDALRQDQERIESANRKLAEANDRLLYQSGHDSLTGVLNRRGLEDRLGRFLSESELAGRPVAVLFCDLDRFKLVNDSFGHAAGDQLLCTTADRIRDRLPDTALLARLGGDEFVAVVSFPSEERDDVDRSAVRLADEVRAAVAGQVSFEGREFVVTTTVGVALLTGEWNTSLDVLRQADRALHYAKDAGRNRVELFGEMVLNGLPPRRVDEEHSVRTALVRGEIVPWYQPIVDARSGRVVGAELLARWIAPDGRMVRARDFISSVNESGLVEEMSEMLVEQACRDIAEWEQTGLPDEFRLSINLPPRFVSRTSRASSLVELLASGPTNRIALEVSEASVVDDLAVAAARLAELRSLGLRVALDDFGTGTASMALLQHMPIDSVKIDQSFIRGLGTELRQRALVAGFVGIAGELSLTVVAEGVETAEQASVLLGLGCRLHQGYLYSDAVDAAQLARLINSGRLGPGIVAPVR